MIRLLPQFPSQLKIHLMLEKINSVIIIKIRLLPSSVAESDSLLAHKAPELNKQTKNHNSPHHPLPSEKKESKVKIYMARNHMI